MRCGQCGQCRFVQDDNASLHFLKKPNFDLHCSRPSDMTSAHLTVLRFPSIIKVFSSEVPVLPPHPPHPPLTTYLSPFHIPLKRGERGGEGGETACQWRQSSSQTQTESQSLVGDLRTGRGSKGQECNGTQLPCNGTQSPCNGTQSPCNGTLSSM